VIIFQYYLPLVAPELSIPLRTCIFPTDDYPGELCPKFSPNFFFMKALMKKFFCIIYLNIVTTGICNEYQTMRADTYLILE